MPRSHTARRSGWLRRSALLAGGLCACSGSVYSERSPRIEDGVPVAGVIVYQPLPRIVTWQTTQLVDANRQWIGTAPEGCEPVLSEEILALPDYTTPWRIYYQPGLFEAGKFSLQLEGGMLESLNSEFTPATRQAVDLAQVLAAAAETTLLGVRAEPSAKGKPACNEGRRVHSTRPLE